jgi:hypothetical protein
MLHDPPPLVACLISVPGLYMAETFNVHIEDNYVVVET